MDSMNPKELRETANGLIALAKSIDAKSEETEQEYDTIIEATLAGIAEYGAISASALAKKLKLKEQTVAGICSRSVSYLGTHRGGRIARTKHGKKPYEYFVVTAVIPFDAKEARMLFHRRQAEEKTLKEFIKCANEKLIEVERLIHEVTSVGKG